VYGSSDDEIIMIDLDPPPRLDNKVTRATKESTTHRTRAMTGNTNKGATVWRRRQFAWAVMGAGPKGGPGSRKHKEGGPAQAAENEVPEQDKTPNVLLDLGSAELKVEGAPTNVNVQDNEQSVIAKSLSFYNHPTIETILETQDEKGEEEEEEDQLADDDD
jgi:hypothetical protein